MEVARDKILEARYFGKTTTLLEKYREIVRKEGYI